MLLRKKIFEQVSYPFFIMFEIGGDDGQLDVRANMPCLVLVPSGSSNSGSSTQIVIYYHKAINNTNTLWDNQAQIAFIVQNLKREFHDLTKQDQGNLKPTLVAYIFYGSLDLKRHTKRKRVWRGVGIICPAIVIELSTQSFQHNTFIRGSKLLAPVGYFADPVCTSLQAVWAEQHAEFT